jgi:signal peptide peptidase SppA
MKTKPAKNKSAVLRAATPTGCTRPDSLFGLWAIEPRRFGEMVETAKSVDLVALAESRRTAAVADGAPGSPLPTLSPERPGKKKADSGDGSDDGDYDPDDDDDPEDLPYRLVNGVALLSINGPMTKYPTSFQDFIGGTATIELRQALRMAMRDPDVTCGMICIDSPGGTVAGAYDLAADIRAFCAVKSCYAYIADTGCSAAYLAASQCDRVYANSNAVVGCIGTMAILRDTSRAYEQKGVKVMVVTSDTTDGETMKGAGADGTPITDDQLADFKRQINEQNDLFVADVATGREMTPENVRALADGRVHVGAKAQALGLVDEITSFDAAMQAIYTETIQMNAESFKAFASANPEDATVKSLLAQGHKAGKAEGRTEARADLAAMLVAFPGREKFAGEQFAKGHDVQSAKAEYADVLAGELSTANAKLAEAQQAQARTAAQAATDNPAVRLPGASAQAAAVAEKKDETTVDPVGAFETAWKAEMKNGVTQMAAIAKVVHEKPELHAAYLAAVQKPRVKR